jgi:hypothetical protein
MAKAITTADSASRPDPILPMTLLACPFGRGGVVPFHTPVTA